MVHGTKGVGLIGSLFRAMLHLRVITKDTWTITRAIVCCGRRTEIHIHMKTCKKNYNNRKSYLTTSIKQVYLIFFISI